MISFKELSEKWGKSNYVGGLTTSFNELSNHYKDIKSENRDTMQYYTNSGSTPINRSLWSQHEWSKKPHQPERKFIHDEKIKHIDDEIHSNRTPRKLVVWSGTAIDPREMKDENNIVHHPAYLSTTLHRKVGENFAYRNKHRISQYSNNFHLLKIHVPKDHPGFLAKEANKDNSEQEFILPRGTNLRYKGTSTEKRSFKGDFSDNDDSIITNHHYLHHMEVMPHTETK